MLIKVCTRTAPWGHPLLPLSGFPYALRRHTGGGLGSEAAACPRTSPSTIHKVGPCFFLGFSHQASGEKKRKEMNSVHERRSP